MSIKKWMQLSDVHFGSPDSHNTEEMRECFLKECDKHQGLDYLFITGDLRYGKDHPQDYPDGTVSFIQNVQKHLGIDPTRTFMVPGNHDVGRASARTKTIETIQEKYLPNRTIADEHKPYLDLERQQYLGLYEKICAKNQIDHHFVTQLSDINIIHIDTAILCGRDGEDGKLVIDMLALRRALEKMDTNMPAIALAHHTFDCLADGEQEQLELLLKRHNTVLFLCGHKHWARGKNIKVRNPDIDLWEFVCGTNMDSAPGEEPAEIGFFTGEVNTESKSGYVEAHKWSPRNNDWLPNNDFSFPQNGAFDGRYYFPKREADGEEQQRDKILEIAMQRYIDFLKYECSEIQLNGLPMDSEVGYKTFALEKLFVPLRFSVRTLTKKQLRRENSGNFEDSKNWRDIPNNIIPDNGSFRRVVFAGPGGGKTTLMKRLASAYGIGKIDAVDDHLPRRTLFPIWVKCRQFGADTPLSLLEIIHKIPERANFPFDSHLEKAFFQIVSKHIQEGTALLLIDGLDEISEESNRLTFIGKLKSFTAMNDKANIVMTSRSVGYEQITNNLFLDFIHCRIQPFNQDDIARLCIGWHKIVLGNTKEVTETAEKLSDAIVQNEKIFKLAQTPVLLTTLLLVNRRIGRLPTKRAALYHEAIKVLLDSWGVEARKPIDLDEALPQLAYLAHHMMFHDGARQTIGKSELVNVLLHARDELPEFFSSSSETVYQFINRVEDRSALLVKRGHRLNEGGSQLETEYEFPHLTFQEYLAAYAIVNRYFPGATRNSNICDCFRGRWEDDDIREVILLTSVLADKWGAQDIATMLLNLLTEIINSRHVSRPKKRSYISNLLLSMISDEAPLTPSIRKEIYKACFASTVFRESTDGILSVYSSKYQAELRISLIHSDNSRTLKFYEPFLKLIEFYESRYFSVFAYYTENMHTNNHLHAVRLLDVAAWMGDKWLGTIPEDIELIKNDLLDLFLYASVDFALPAFSALYSLHESDNAFFSGKLLQSLLRIIDEYPIGMHWAHNFPVTEDTILHLHGISLSAYQRELLHEQMESGLASYNIVGCFWFGVLLGAWDIETVICKAKELHSAEYISADASDKLYSRMKAYLSIIHDAGVLTPGAESVAEKYLSDMESKRKSSETQFDFDEDLQKQLEQKFDELFGKNEDLSENSAQLDSDEYENENKNDTTINETKPMDDDEGEELDSTIVLTDEDGEDVKFEFIDLIEFEGDEYVILLPIDATSEEVVILQVEETDNEDEESYVSVDDEDKLANVFGLFKERHQDEFNFVDDNT